MSVEITVPTDLDQLIPDLRLHIWDYEVPYTFSDDMLKFCLVAGLKMLMPRWSYRYIPIDNTTSWSVARSTEEDFPLPSPPVIMYHDERPIILAAAIMLKSGKIYTASWDTVSWRDDEVSYSNITGGKMAEGSLLRDMDELDRLIPARGKRLAQAKKQSLLGFSSATNEMEG